VSETRAITGMTGAHDHGHSPARVLLVIDQPVLAEVVKLALNHGLFHAEVAATAPEALAALAQRPPHLAIVDMDLAQGHMLDRLVGTTPDAARIPTVALTRRGNLKTTLAAFDRGVDDILSVPFSPEELVARVLALMRRTYGAEVAFTPTIRLGELEIDILNRHVRAGTSELHLTGLEQNLLYLLAANAGRVLSRDEILDALWGVDLWQTATWWTGTSATCASSYRTAGGARATSRPCRGTAIASSPPRLTRWVAPRPRHPDTRV